MSPVDRQFRIVLGLSVLLHAAFLGLVPGQQAPRPSALPTLSASIRLLEAALPASVPAARSMPELRKALPPAAPVALPPQARQTGTSVLPSPTVLPQLAAGPAATPASSGLPSVAQPSSPSAGDAVAAVGSPQPPARSSQDALDSYRHRLAGLFAARHDYPRVAALRGWEGEVRLRLKIARKGNLLGVALDRSSGYEVLDQHAMALLADYGDLPPLPEAVELGEIQVVVPINYKLRRTT